jgi:hypothetical protein
MLDFYPMVVEQASHPFLGAITEARSDLRHS